MKRYIKVKHKWIDTLTEQKLGKIYFAIDKYVWCDDYSDKTSIGVFSYMCGKLQDEADELFTNEV